MKNDITPGDTAKASIEAWVTPRNHWSGELQPSERTDEDCAIIKSLIAKRLRQHFMTHDNRDLIYNQVLNIAWDYHNSGSGWKAPWDIGRARLYVELQVRRDALGLAGEIVML